MRVKLDVLFFSALVAAALLPGTVLAQSTYDTSGNALVQGNYFIPLLSGYKWNRFSCLELSSNSSWESDS
jgi:hypothetical protein